jgi:hypothetical protein
MNAKIYEVKSGAAHNYRPLVSPDGKSFYWNGAKFVNNRIGDVVFVVSRNAQEALFTTIAETDITATYNEATDRSVFTNLYNTYSPQGKWDKFIRFDIKEKAAIPSDWRWTKQLGQSETFDLWKPGIKDAKERLSKTTDLMKLFTAGAANDQLVGIAQQLEGVSFKGFEIITMDEILQREDIKQILQAEEFWFENARNVFREFLQFDKPVDFYSDLLTKYKAEKDLSYPAFIQERLQDGSEEQLFALLMGKLISYMDRNAAHKNIWNDYPDKRVFARASIRMGNWLENLMRFKIGNNSWNELSPGVRNALEYANDPNLGIPIVSEEHKSLISEFILLKPYDRLSFISDLKAYFSQYDIQVKKIENETFLYSRILYADQVKPIWKQSIGGLVAIEPNTNNWMDNAVQACADTNGIVLWWSRMPTGEDSTIQKLVSKINRDKYFELFYIVNGFVQYRAEVIDIATADSYAQKTWKDIENLAWVHDNFNEYADGTQSAAVVFMAQSFEKLAVPFSVNTFTWFSDYTAPRKDNLQPFEEYNIDSSTSVLSNNDVMQDASFKTILNFDDTYADVLAAIQTKPFILLAGISGTGKSRLARSLAYHTCSRKELQYENRPGNFEMITVLPNWHDSSELVGYETRLSGTLEYKITAFLRFLVKARKYSDLPFFLCLDEMNIAPVEQYFAEFLSIIESRRYKQDGMVSDPFLSAEVIQKYAKYMGDSFWLDLGIENDLVLQEDLKANGLQLPGNLVVMGTVNMDETTHSFSRKVLDRALTFEMNQVDLMKGLEQEDEDLKYPDTFYHPCLVLGNMQGGKEAFEKLSEDGGRIIDQLITINLKLEKTPFKLAYRVRDEMLVYCYYRSKADNKPTDWLQKSLDQFLVMKLLSRIEGDTRKCKTPLDSLKELLPNSFERCHTKLDEMIEKLDQDNYTSFWT